MFGTRPPEPGAPHGDIQQRNAWWHMFFVQLIASNPHLADVVPENAAVFILPEHDSELCDYNRRLAHMEEGPKLLIDIEVEDRYAKVQTFELKGSGRYALA